MREGYLKTASGGRIAYALRSAGHERLVVIVHGFYINKDVLLLREMAQALAAHFDVLSFDLRGHGRSSGVFSWTSHEQEDVRAVLTDARDRGYQRIGLVGFSLGAAISLITAANDGRVMSLAAISAPADFWGIDYRFWEPDMLEDLKLNLGPKGRGKGVRPGNPFEPKVSPLSVVDRIAPRPVLFVHGSEDWLIKPRHSHELFARAGEPRRLEIINGAGHAERIFDTHREPFLELLRGWFDRTL